jgi:uncharacterized protein (DUF1501 family)
MTHRLTRRDFLKSASVAAGLTAVHPARARAASAEPATDRVLVLVHLEGGNDGLNTVVPWGDAEYYRLRPTIALGPDRLIPISRDLAFNDRFGDVARLYGEGCVAVVLGVGCPDSSRSHFRAAEMWRAAGAPDAEDRGASLRDIAEQIRRGSSPRVHRVTFTGFDTHANQAAKHGRLLERVGRSLADFQERLRRDGTSRQVLTVVYSEFGRRPEENVSGGTDHGTAGPVFLIGDGVAGGIHGTMPRLDDLEHGDLRHVVDYRRVYATVLRGWFGKAGTDASPTLPVLA